MRMGLSPWGCARAYRSICRGGLLQGPL